MAAGGAGDCVRGRITKALAHDAELRYDATTMHIVRGEGDRVQRVTGRGGRKGWRLRAA